MKNFLIILVLLVSRIVHAQVTEEWVQRFNGTGNNYDSPHDITVDDNGNVYLTGYTNSNFSGTDIVTIKYDPSGIIQWQQIYNGTTNKDEGGRAIVLDDSGNVYVAGATENGIGSVYDFITIKYNSAGNQQWVKKFNGIRGGNDAATSIAIDDAGNIYVAGISEGIGTGYDILLVKYNPSGTLQWNRRYAGLEENPDEAKSVAVDNNGNIYVAGNSLGDYINLKYSSNGSLLWVRKYSGFGNDILQQMVIDAGGNTYLTGSSVGWNGTLYDYATVKYDSDGNELWSARYNGPPGNDQDNAYSVAVDNQGNVFVTGSSKGIGTGTDATTIKYNSAGQEQWVKRYNGFANLGDRGSDVKIDQSGSIYITGLTKEQSSGYDILTVKYNSNGDEVWMKKYNGPANFDDDGHKLVVDDNYNTYVTGISSGVGTFMDITLIKYSQSLRLQRGPVAGLPDDYSLSQNYPNPFNPTTRIKFGIPELVQTDLVVYDINGRLVKTLVSEELNAGTYEYEFDASTLSSGVYFYKLLAGGFSDTKKMLVVK